MTDFTKIFFANVNSRGRKAAAFSMLPRSPDYDPLGLPLVERGAADPVLAADIAGLRTGLLLPQNPNDLFFGEPALPIGGQDLHPPVPKYSEPDPQGNPTKGVKPFRGRKTERFLTDAEVGILGEALVAMEGDGSPREWAWEFLRRNEKYQELWEEFDSLAAQSGFIYKGLEGRKIFEITERFEKELGVSRPAPPSMTSTDADFKRRLRFVAPPQYWIKRQDWPDKYDFDMTGADLEHPAELLAKFDLRSKIEPQVRKIKEILKEEAKNLAKIGVKEPRGKFQMYQRYLRVLDAKLSGAKDKTIALEVLGIQNEGKFDPQYSKNKVRDVFRAAQRLRDNGYRFLAALEAMT